MYNKLAFIILIFFFTNCSNSKSNSDIKKNKKETKSSINNSDSPLFSLLSPEESGFYFLNEVKSTENLNVINYENYYNGGGVGVGDINNDGLPDIFMTGNLFAGRLFLNKGNMKFEQISESANVFHSGFTTDVSFIDINNDGYKDIYLCRSLTEIAKDRTNLLLINNKDNTFTESASKYGIDDSGYSNQSIFFDYDNDGDLDLYIVNHRTDFDNAQSIYDKKSNKGNVTPTDKFWNPSSADQLYRNDGDKFVNVTKKTNIVNNDFSLSAMATDLNGDNLIDIYVSNDFVSKDHAYINQGNGTFIDKIDTYFSHISKSTMGMDIGDINNDGLLDIFTVDMTPEDSYRQKQLKSNQTFDSYHLAKNYGFHEQIPRNMLQLNNGNNTYSEIAQLANIAYTDWSWSTLIADFDNDGWSDIFICNGHQNDITDLDYIKYKSIDAINKAGGIPKVKKMDLLKLMSSTKISNYSFRNLGNLEFKNKSKDWGLSKPSHSNGAAYADLDLDGDLDLIVNNFNQPSFLYRNNSEKISNNNYVKIKLTGSEKNIEGYGSRLLLYCKNQIQIREITPYKGFLSSVDPTAHFGIGKAEIVDSIKVIWWNGKSELKKGIKPNETIEFNIKNAISTNSKIKNPRKITYLNWNHKENSYNDFKLEPLMEHFQSNKGPVSDTADINNDGLTDLYIGGSYENTGAFLIQTKDRGYKILTDCFKGDEIYEDGGCAFFDLNNDGLKDLYVSSGSNEKENEINFIDRIYINKGNNNFEKLLNHTNTKSSSTVQPIDFDQDGDEDLFIGGQTIKNSYPLATNSTLLKNENGILKDVSSILPKKGNLGIINFAEVINKNELLIGGEWTPVMHLKLEKNENYIISKNNGLELTHGWWNSINYGDFDNDGDMDFIVGNRGNNTMYKAYENKPAKIYYGDFDDNDDLDAIPVYYFQTDNNYYPKHSLDQLFKQLKSVRKTFKNYNDYSKATIDKIIPDNTPYKIAYTFNSSYIENLGNGQFKVAKLPIKAQFSSVRGIATHDFNKDGNLDFIIVGNNFKVDTETGSDDACKGSIFLGDGKNKFIELNTNNFSTNGYDAREVFILENDKLIITTNDGPILKFTLNRLIKG